MSAHTPGPWHVVSKFVGPLQVTDEAGEAVALVGHVDFDVCSDRARLIAAAPDLLAALERIAGTMSDENVGLLLGGMTLGASSDTSGDTCRMIARAALAKAKGEA